MPVTVLVVEDDGLIRLDLADTLSDAGYDVLEAANADQAMAILQRRNDIKMLLTDIDMPGSMNGIQLAAVTAMWWPDCAIVVISGRYTPVKGVLPSGARFIAKPVSEKLLHSVLSQIPELS